MLWKNMIESLAKAAETLLSCGLPMTYIDALAEEEQELEALVESIHKTCTKHKMEISAEKTKLMTNSANGIQREIKGRSWVL